jgi:hypothetical protein
MGLTTWEDAPQGKIIKSDVVIAKNYLIDRVSGLPFAVKNILHCGSSLAFRAGSFIFRLLPQ